MSQFDTPTEAALSRFKSEELSSSPVDGAVEKVANLGGMILEAIGFKGASAGIGFLSALKNLAANKDEANLIYFGEALVDDIRRLYRLHEELRQQFDESLKSLEFNSAVANATLHITRTNIESRLKRLAHLLTNGVSNNDLEPESLDDMMRAAVELKDRDVSALKFIHSFQSEIMVKAGKWPDQWLLDVQKSWQSSTFERGVALQKAGSDDFGWRSSLSRLQAFGFIIAVPANSTTNSPGNEPYGLLPEGFIFLQRLKEMK
jgi:hypothetical protein